MDGDKGPEAVEDPVGEDCCTLSNSQSALSTVTNSDISEVIWVRRLVSDGRARDRQSSIAAKKTR